MSRGELTVPIDLLDQKSPHILNVKIVDRGILDDEDVDYILSCLPPVSMARVDADSYKPFLGIDMFYDEEASLRGVIFVYGSRALAVRVPANIAKTSAKAYEEEKAASRKYSGRPNAKLKGKPVSKVTRLTGLECLRKLFQSDLAGFGMAQISLTLWHFLRERAGGVNLSTATSKPVPPPTRTMPEPKSEDGFQPNKGTQNGQQTDTPCGRGNQEGSGKRGSGRGEAKGGRKGSQRDNAQENPGEEDDPSTISPVILPDDEPLNWDREILSPGDVFKGKIYPGVSRIHIDSVFVGNDKGMDLEGRVIEAAKRAWVSSVVAEKLNAEVQTAPVVQPTRLCDKELTFFAESMVAKWKALGEAYHPEPLQLEQFEDEDGMLKSNKYETKLRAGKVARQYLGYAVDDVETRRYLQRPGDSKKTKHTYLAEDEDERPEPPEKQKSDAGGWADAPVNNRGHQQRRQGQVRADSGDTSEFQGPDSSTTPAPKKPPVSLPKDVEIFIYGREEATESDKQRDMFILRLLEGRGSLHGPKYKDCAFIRRVWFPTQAQILTGEGRKATNSKTTRGRHDWIDGDWGDDTDEEEVARIQALRLEDDDEDQEDETEDEDVGMEDPTRGVTLSEEIRLNSSQERVVARVVAPNPRGRTRATLVHGPPGTGKTSTIAAAVVILAEVGEPVWIVAQSNVGIKNVAEKLQDVEFNDFTLLVAKDYHSYWGERYTGLMGRFLPTNMLNFKSYQKRLFGSKVVLCTLATLSSPILDKKGVFIKRPLQHLIVDEASQIDMTSEFMHLFYKHRDALKSVCWFGDPKQLPPFGWSEGTEIQDIFKVEHLLANSRFLDTSYRLPVPIAKYISRAVYESKLKEDRKHKVQLPRNAVVFVDVSDGGEAPGGGKGKSWQNEAEAEVVFQLIQTYYERRVKQEWQDEEEQLEYEIITPYEGQRSIVDKMIEAAQIKKLDGSKRQVYNVDSFQ
ncbi:hypothetical protein FRC10_002899, partial [Ceratobasidium sp. 414]